MDDTSRSLVRSQLERYAAQARRVAALEAELAWQRQALAFRARPLVALAEFARSLRSPPPRPPRRARKPPAHLVGVAGLSDDLAALFWRDAPPDRHARRRLDRAIRAAAARVLAAKRHCLQQPAASAHSRSHSPRVRHSGRGGIDYALEQRIHRLRAVGTAPETIAGRLDLRKETVKRVLAAPPKKLPRCPDCGAALTVTPCRECDLAFDREAAARVEAAQAGPAKIAPPPGA